MNSANSKRYFAVHLTTQEGRKLSYIWDSQEVLELSAFPGIFLAYEGGNTLLVDSNSKGCKVVNSNSASDSLDCNGFSLSLNSMDPGTAVLDADVKKFAHHNFSLKSEKAVDESELQFKSYLKHASLAAVIAVASLVAVSSFQSETDPLPIAEVVEKKSPVLKTKKIKGLPSQKSLEKAYQKAIAKNRPVATSKKAAGKAVAQRSAVDKVKDAFAGLLNTGIALPSKSKQSRGVAPSARLSGAVRSGRAAGSGAIVKNSADSIVKVAMIGGEGGAAGYGVGGDAAGIGIGGLAGQGEDWVALNVNDATIEEGLSRDEVGRVIHGKISEIRYCYEASMIRSPDLEGKLIIDFTIAASGRVRSAKVNQETVSDARLNECILKRLTKWGFPKPKAGVEVAVSYPFIFKRLGR